MTAVKNSQTNAGFLDMQAAVGVTKHVGGFAATDELLALCHFQDAREVLNVGCGIGVGPAYIAKRYDCRVVGVDISEKMLAWAQRRAAEEGVADRVEFRTADVLALPFPAERFDAVICESVLVFVDDKASAIRECVRVTRPGGYVGLNEGFWFERPAPELVARVKHAIGPAVPTLEEWEALWATAGLQDRVVQPHRVDASTEMKSRIQWIGWRWLVRAWGRALRLYFTNPAVRQAIKDQFDVPAEACQYLGYGLFVGRK
jgi:ubiquinone/menaquinone biosynthesis C-methylase UbiE